MSTKTGCSTSITALACVGVTVSFLAPADVMAYFQTAVGTPITPVSITKPTASDFWLAGSNHTVTCTTSTDSDQVMVTPESPWIPKDDDVTDHWTGTGTFQNNQIIGTSVVYICTDTSGTNSITVTAQNDTPIFADDVVTDTKIFNVIIPVLDQVTYSGSNYPITDVTTPEYDRTSSRNDPAAYLIGALEIAAQPTFWAPDALTEASTVNVSGIVNSPTMDDWTTNDTASFGTSWPSAQAQVSSNISPTATVQVFSYNTLWQYRCPDGSNNWISAFNQTGNVFYIVRAAPALAFAEPKLCYQFSCSWAAGLTAASSNINVCDAILGSWSSKYTYDGSHCNFFASDFTHLVSVQGVAVTQQKWQVQPTKPRPVAVSMSDGVWPAWKYHWWVSVDGKNYDPSKVASLVGTWGDYEDKCIQTYKVSTVSGFYTVTNPAGQDMEQTVWSLLPTNPFVFNAVFIGP